MQKKHSLVTPPHPPPSSLQRVARKNLPLRACPSVDAEKHSVPVFDCSQMVPYTGSRWLNSMVDSSATRLPLRVSQQAGGEGNEGQVDEGTGFLSWCREKGTEGCCCSWFGRHVGF